MAAKRFPVKLKAFREKRGMSQAQLAERAGVTREYIARLESGKHDPPLSRVDKLAKALGVTLRALVE